MKNLKATSGSLVATAFLLSVGSASATSFTLANFNTSTAGLAGPPYGTVSVVLDSANKATITFTSANGYLFIDGSSDAVNVNSSDFSAALISDTAPAGNAAFSQFNYGSQEVDGWGHFNLTLDQNNSGPNDRATSISFSVTDLNGTWGSADNVLDANDDGHNVAAHMIVPGGGFTGYASDGPNNESVPDGGGTAFLLGAAVSTIGLIRRKLS